MNRNDFVVFDYVYDEDDNDELYEEEDSGKANSQRSLLSLYIYDILRTLTSPYRHMTQAELVERLDQYPYSLPAERKSVGRTVKTLVRFGTGIRSGKDGIWFEPRTFAA